MPCIEQVESGISLKHFIAIVTDEDDAIMLTINSHVPKLAAFFPAISYAMQLRVLSRDSSPDHMR